MLRRCFPRLLAAALALPLALAAQQLTLPHPRPKPVPQPQATASTPAVAAAKAAVQQAVAALGGPKYLQANERETQGLLYSFNSAGELNGFGTRFWAYYRFPADERIELTKKRNVIYIYAGGKGWQITYKGVEPLTPRQIQQYQITSSHSIDVILKSWAADPQTLMLDQGQGMFDEAQVDTVLFTSSTGESASVDFSLRTRLPLRVHWQETDPDTGGRYIASIIYGNWAMVDGVEVPFSVDRYQGLQRLEQQYFTKIQITKFSPGLFTPKPLKK